jgi:hypothetical protein
MTTMAMASQQQQPELQGRHTSYFPPPTHQIEVIGGTCTKVGGACDERLVNFQGCGEEGEWQVVEKTIGEHVGGV